jgi:plasmid replication initiation protein
MGTHLHGRFDHLVIELGPIDAVRLQRRRLPVPLDAIRAVRTGVGGPRSLVVGSHRHPAVVLELERGLDAERIVVHLRDAVDVAADLIRSGVGRQAPAPAVLASA